MKSWFFITGELIYMYKYFNNMDFFLTGYNYLIFFLTLLTFVFDAIQYISNIFTIYIIVLTYIGMSFFCLAPLYLNYRNGFLSGHQSANSTYACIICINIPKLIDTHDFNILPTIYTVYSTYPCSISICSIDLLLSLMAFQIIGHILILRNDLENIEYTAKGIEKNNLPDNTENDESFQMFNDEENKIIHEKFISCINHHRQIMTFTEDVSEFFGPVLAANYGFQLVACCLLLMECSTGVSLLRPSIGKDKGRDAIFRFGPLTMIIFGQLIMLSVLFEIVATVSDKLKNSVYFTPWEQMDTRNRRTMHIMLMRSQKPVTISAMGLTNVGVTTMAQILKTTVSYYMLLRSVAE